MDYSKANAVIGFENGTKKKDFHVVHLWASVEHVKKLSAQNLRDFIYQNPGLNGEYDEKKRQLHLWFEIPVEFSKELVIGIWEYFKYCLREFLGIRPIPCSC